MSASLHSTPSFQPALSKSPDRTGAPPRVLKQDGTLKLRSLKRTSLTNITPFVAADSSGTRNSHPTRNVVLLISRDVCLRFKARKKSGQSAVMHPRLNARQMTAFALQPRRVLQEDC